MSKDTQITSIDDEQDEVAVAAATPAKAKGKGATAAPVAEPQAQALASVSGAGSGLTGETAVLTIHPGQEDGGSDAVFISVNGFAWQIPRGKPWTVPIEVVEALDQCVETKYTTEGKNVIERQVPRFAYTVRG